MPRLRFGKEGSKHEKQLWETRPLECWQLAKELRRKYDRSSAIKPTCLKRAYELTLDWQGAFPAIKVVEDNPVAANDGAAERAVCTKGVLQARCADGAAKYADITTLAGARSFSGTADGEPFRAAVYRAVPLRVTAYRARPAMPRL